MWLPFRGSRPEPESKSVGLIQAEAAAEAATACLADTRGRTAEIAKISAQLRERYAANHFSEMVEAMLRVEKGQP